MSGFPLAVIGAKNHQLSRWAAAWCVTARSLQQAAVWQALSQDFRLGDRAAPWASRV